MHCPRPSVLCRARRDAAGSVGAVSSQLQSLSLQFNQFQQQAQSKTDHAAGVAMSLAMDGVGDLGPDEKSRSR